MGSCLSCKSSRKKFNNIRVVHLNGYVEEYDNPVSVGQIITSQPGTAKLVVFTAVQLLSAESRPLQSDAQLESGKLYFLLPCSIFQGDCSPVDLLSLVKKLSSTAKSTRSCTDQAKSSGICKSLLSQSGPILCESPAAKPWKPVLETIREKSFNCRTESELQDMDFETPVGSLRYDVFL